MLNITSALDICNLALAKLGESPIPAIDPNGSPASRQCYLHYQPTRRELLCAHRWSFAEQIAQIDGYTSSGGLPGELETYKSHSLPADCLRVLSVNVPRWILRGRNIYATQSPIRLIYIADCEVVGIFEPLFIEALATRLAYKMCTALTSSSTLKQSLAEEYSRVSLPNAAHFNAVQNRSNDMHPLYRMWKSRGGDGEFDF